MEKPLIDFPKPPSLKNGEFTYKCSGKDTSIDCSFRVEMMDPGSINDLYIENLSDDRETGGDMAELNAYRI